MLLYGDDVNNWVDINDAVLTNLDDVITFESHRAALLQLLPGEEIQSHIYPMSNLDLED